MLINLKDKKLFEKNYKPVKVIFFLDKRSDFAKKITEKELKNIKEGEFEIFNFKNGRWVFYNLGESKKIDLKKLRLFIRKLVRFLKGREVEFSDWYIENLLVLRVSEKNKLIEEIVKNILLANYDFDKYKSKKGKKIKAVNLFLSSSSKYKKYLKEARVIAESVNFVRDLANIPGSEMTPKKLTQIAKKELAKIKNVSVRVFDKKRIKKEKMGGVLGVSRGSKEEPRFIIAKYSGNKKSKNIDLAFVGKGVTFDSGGLNIKLGDSMGDMYMDMAGAGAVIGALRALALLKLPLNIVVLVPAVENMPSSESYRPGDVLKAYNGKTIEVLNTDAEGRIILADALSYAVKNFKPKIIIDVATLTGAAMVALGQRIAAVFTNKEKLEETLKKIGLEAGDYVWSMPLWDEYQEDIKGSFGDIQNIAKTRYGGAITGAMFLKNFVEDRNIWIHLDIAPTMTSIDSNYLAKGATGAGTNFLIELAKNYKKLWA